LVIKKCDLAALGRGGGSFFSIARLTSAAIQLFPANGFAVRFGLSDFQKSYKIARENVADRRSDFNGKNWANFERRLTDYAGGLN